MVQLYSSCITAKLVLQYCSQHDPFGCNMSKLVINVQMFAAKPRCTVRCPSAGCHYSGTKRSMMLFPHLLLKVNNVIDESDCQVPIDTVNQGTWCLSVKLRLECFVIVA